MLLDNSLTELLTKKSSKFFLTPVLMDNGYEITKKVFKCFDSKVFQKVFELTHGKPKKNYLKELINLRKNEDILLQLGWPGVMRKDYKNYTFGLTAIGISSIFIELERCVETFTFQAMREAVGQLLEEKSIWCYIALHQSIFKGRPFVVYLKDKEVGEKFVQFLKQHENFEFSQTEDKFDGFGEELDIYSFFMIDRLGNSRKFLEPVFREFWEEHYTNA
mmetsp:Transcript_35649/g.41281  ORF Transcript_35649/g.41281 Transcript_35649/m.41281 type:complete len:219 (-) Transcript_35649:24-680(-)